MTQPPPFQNQPPGFGGQPQTFTCPKCGGSMRTFNRNGVHIEQCESCRGIFLDFGEFEHLTRLESQYTQQPPPAPGPGQGYGPGWGSHGGHRYRKKGFGGLFFSS